MNILHTSDWHIGRALYGKKRYDEFASFFNWLLKTIDDLNIDVLIVAGDIFDTSTPSNRAQQLYYQFLHDLSGRCCRHVIIVGGNHDSPSLLEAPRELLRACQIHVIGRAAENLEDEVRVLKSAAGEDELIVCAVPYLRDREIRTSLAGESLDDKNSNLINGIAAHYRHVADIAKTYQQSSVQTPPIVATGHLFAAGGKKVEGDGVRDLYVGSLAYVDTSVFPECIDYLALGHLHSSQLVGQDPTRRYCGSPLPMSFNDAAKEKYVLKVSINGHEVNVQPITVPSFQKLKTIRGDISHILAEIAVLKEQQERIWLEILYEGKELLGDLQSTLRAAVENSTLDILRIVNNRLITRIIEQSRPEETLENMTEEAVFQRCLEAHIIPANQCEELLNTFRETLQSIADEDRQAE